jgi:drug/metabolite transporter (DMT)-like permease
VNAAKLIVGAVSVFVGVMTVFGAVSFWHDYPRASVTLAFLMAFLFGFGVLWIRHLNKRGRGTLLRALRVLPPSDRERLLAKFTPQFQAELKKELQENATSI